MSAFRTVTEQQAGAWSTFRVLTCSRCGFDGRIRQNKPRPLPDEFIRRKFQEMGWRGDVCRRCAEGKKPMSPAARRAAFCAINNTKRADEPRKLEKVAMAADPPRSPTPEERRRVREALYDHYHEDRGCYRQAFSDQSLAAKLKVPPKWVEEIREALGFGPDVNEAAAQKAEEARLIREEMQKLQNELIAKFDALEGRLKKLEIDHSYAA